MKKLVVVGGSNGIGAALVANLEKEYNEITIVDCAEPLVKPANASFVKFDLRYDNFCSLNDVILSADTLIITAGIGRVKHFVNYSLSEIEKVYSINLVGCTKLLHMFYPRLLEGKDIKCMVIGSIAGDISSPLFSVYGASKAGVNKLCESINCELKKAGSKNVITCIKPLSLKNTSFNGGATNVDALSEITSYFISCMNERKTSVYYDEKTCLDVLNRYHNNRELFSSESYEYKVNGGRVQDDFRIKVGYLSGTFDLFHVGHLNILKKAKEHCDYLIVGVHKDGSWKGKETFIPLEERMRIVESIKYVDKVVVSYPEDSDGWNDLHYDYLFVGSDYKGSERFARYEKVLKGKAQIIYFDYTKSTSSTQIRDLIKKSKDN